MNLKLAWQKLKLRLTHGWDKFYFAGTIGKGWQEICKCDLHKETIDIHTELVNKFGVKPCTNMARVCISRPTVENDKIVYEEHLHVCKGHALFLVKDKKERKRIKYRGEI